MKKINIAELLKDCPKGMELDCTVYDNVTLEKVFEGCLYPIRIQTPEGLMDLTKYGSLSSSTHSKCVIFPKGKTTWEGFDKPFKDGDIISDSLGTCIFKGEGEFKGTVNYYCGINNDNFHVKDDKRNPSAHYGCIVDYRLSTEEEKQKLFDAIKANGYKWNAETKTLEKLVEPKFKVGDRIKSVMSSSYYTVVDIKNNNYFIKSDTEKYPYQVSFENEINYKLVPNKFDITTLAPFESRVLVRDNERQYWKAAFWGFFEKGEFLYDTTRGIYKQCIPYEGNEHLLGKTDDCDEFYKTWK